MSDRTYAQVIVWDCPDDQRAACLAAILDTFGGQLNEAPSIDTRPDATGDDAWRVGRWIPAPDLVLGERYGDDECPLDMADTLADAIREAAPGATFEAWADPKYEYPGDLRIVTPDLGLFGASCDADGGAYLSAHELVALIDNAQTLDGLREEIATRTGAPWHRRIDELRARLAA